MMIRGAIPFLSTIIKSIPCLPPACAWLLHGSGGPPRRHTNDPQAHYLPRWHRRPSHWQRRRRRRRFRSLSQDSEHDYLPEVLGLDQNNRSSILERERFTYCLIDTAFLASPAYPEINAYLPCTRSRFHHRPRRRPPHHRHRRQR